MLMKKVAASLRIIEDAEIKIFVLLSSIFIIVVIIVYSGRCVEVKKAFYIKGVIVYFRYIEVDKRLHPISPYDHRLLLYQR